MTGRLVLVAGPSGAGKDSVLRYAMARFEGDGRFVFPKRIITRRVDATAEDHETLDVRTFDALAAQGAFALVWEAHGLKYAVHREIDGHLLKGCVVAVNVSRTILADVGRLYSSVVVVEISASPEIRAARIAARGRESTPDIQLRLNREVPLPASKLQVHTIRNDGDLSESGNAFCELITPFALGPLAR